MMTIRTKKNGMTSIKRRKKEVNEETN